MGHSLALNAVCAAVIDRSTAISVMKLAPTDFRNGHAGFTGGGEQAQLDGFMPSNNVLSMSNLYSSAFFTRVFLVKNDEEYKSTDTKEAFVECNGRLT